MKNLIFGSMITLVIVGIVLGNGVLITAGAGFLAGIFTSDILKKFEKKGINSSIENSQNNRIERDERSEEKSGVKYDNKVEEQYRHLKTALNGYYGVELFKESAGLTLTQLDRTKEKLERFITILNEKFDKEEITYSRFFATVEQVYKVLMENMEKIEKKFQGIGGSDYEYLVKRLESIEHLTTHTQAQIEEMSAIRHKKGMVKKELKSISEMIAVNEEVISSLDRILIETSNLSTTSSSLDVSSDFARKELEELIKNARQYNIG